MFTWICPKCGREVPPSNAECPFCVATVASPAQPPQQAQPTIAPLQYPPQQYPPQQPQQPQYPQPQYPQPQYPQPSAPQQYQYPPQLGAQTPPPQQTYLVGENDNKRIIPPWAAAFIAFAGVALLVYALVSYTQNKRLSASTAPATKKAAERAGDHPYKRFLELTGFRISEGKGKKLQVEFVAVNHGPTEMVDLGGIITLKARGAENDPPACTFKFRVSSIPSFGAKEVSVSDFTQKRKFFEMPDWQFYEPVLEITSPE